MSETAAAQATDDPVLKNAPDREESPLEEATREQLGLRHWQRPKLFRETADAATDTDLPFWMVLYLSGAIATLGLTLNSTAVVIGAMLVAPLLGPLMGLSMALAVGDGRLFVQTTVTILLGTAGIIALAALLTYLLPFQAMTDEIASRTRPTTLDLGIAIFSGLAGAVVTASREKRLSASIPGVAVAVALVPPLGVAGFGIGTGFQWAIIKGSLLLFGANLAGIVLSGLLIFLLVGMHRSDVVKVAREWHQSGDATGLAARLDHLEALDRIKVLSTPWMRVLLVVAFMIAVAVPLLSSFNQIRREARVAQAVAQATSVFEEEDETSVLDKSITYNEDTAEVLLRIATTEWVTKEEEEAFVRNAERMAGERITLRLEQVLASSGDLESFAAALPTRPPVRTKPESPQPVALPEAVATIQERMNDALQNLTLPDSLVVVGGVVWVESNNTTPVLEIAYGSPRPLPAEAETILARQAAQALGFDIRRAQMVPISLGQRPFPDSARAAEWAVLLRRYARLRLQLTGDSAEVARLGQQLRAGNVSAKQIATRQDSSQRRAQFEVIPAETP